MADTSLTPALDSLPTTPAREMPLTVSPADTSLSSPEPNADVKEEDEEEEETEKKPAKKRKSWGQELPVPKTNLPPRYVATTFSFSSQRTDLPDQKTGQDRR